MSNLIAREFWYTEREDGTYVSFITTRNITQCKRVKVVLSIGDEYIGHYFYAFDGTTGVFATIKITALNGLGSGGPIEDVAKTTIFSRNNQSFLELDFKLPQNVGNITGFSVETMITCSTVGSYDSCTTIEYYDD